MECPVCMDNLDETREATDDNLIQQYKLRVPNYQSIPFLQTCSDLDVCMTNCGHLFHQGCLQQWCASELGVTIGSTSCPSCRKALDLSQIIQIDQEENANRGGNADDGLWEQDWISAEEEEEEDEVEYEDEVDSEVGTQTTNPELGASSSQQQQNEVVDWNMFENLLDENDTLIIDWHDLKRKFLQELEELELKNQLQEKLETELAILKSERYVLQEKESLRQQEQASSWGTPSSSSLSSSWGTPSSSAGAAAATTSSSASPGNPAYQPCKLYVNGVKESLSHVIIAEHFEMFGEVQEVKWPYDHVTRKKRGFCFVLMRTEEAANLAVSQRLQQIPALDGALTRVTVQRALPDATKKDRRNANSNVRTDNRGYGPTPFVPPQFPQRRPPNVGNNSNSTNSNRLTVSSNNTTTVPQLYPLESLRRTANLGNNANDNSNRVAVTSTSNSVRAPSYHVPFIAQTPSNSALWMQSSSLPSEIRTISNRGSGNLTNAGDNWGWD